MPEGLRLNHLRVSAGSKPLVHEASLALVPGGIHVLVGASGSGKSLTARSLLGLLPGLQVDASLEIEVGSPVGPADAAPPSRAAGPVGPADAAPPSRAPGRILRPWQDGSWREVRGSLVGWLPQDARGSLDPLWTVGRQVRESLALAGRPPDVDPWLKKAGLGPEVAALWPHQLSGGMAQRASIALALARGSRFLIADEPTTGLDPSVQEGILREVLALRDQGVGILFITHDLRLVPRLADRLLVMHEGRIVEDLPAGEKPTSAPALALWSATERIAAGLL